MKPVIIGAGHNGLTAAFYLAKAGLEPIVFERAETIGGGAVTGELHPGFRCPTLNHHVALRSDIIADMQLVRHGVEFLNSPVEAFAPALAGPAAVIYGDDQRTADALRAVHATDAARYATYRASLGAVCRVLRSLLTTPAPGIDEPDVRDLWNLLQAGRQFRALGANNAYGLLRWAPMPVADFAGESSRGTAFGWYNLVAGLAAIPAGLLFGSVWHFQGSAAAFTLAAAVALAAVGLLRAWAWPRRAVLLS